jgi:hypothetical protein
MVHYYIISLADTDAARKGPVCWAGPFTLKQARDAKAKTFQHERFVIIKAQIVDFTPTHVGDRLT